MRNDRLSYLMLIILTALPLLTRDAGADAMPRTRSGFAAGIGIGAAQAGLAVGGSGSDPDREFGGITRVSFGWAVRPQFLLGFEGNYWLAEVSGVTWGFQVNGFSIERWSPFFGQSGGLVKVDSPCLIMPPSSDYTSPSASCRRQVPSGDALRCSN